MIVPAIARVHGTNSITCSQRAHASGGGVVCAPRPCALSLPRARLERPEELLFVVVWKRSESHQEWWHIVHCIAVLGMGSNPAHLRMYGIGLMPTPSALSREKSPFPPSVENPGVRQNRKIWQHRVTAFVVRDRAPTGDRAHALLLRHPGQRSAQPN